MKDFLLQTQSNDNLQSSLSENISSFVERVNPLQLPHESFVTDLAIIMILAAIVTLAFFKIRQPLIIGYLFAGMLIGPLGMLFAIPAAGIFKVLLNEIIFISKNSHLLLIFNFSHLPDLIKMHIVRRLLYNA